jgi:hypothetical protein
MSKLTKTEKKILEKASGEWNGLLTTVQREGVVSKRLAAVQSLRDKGLLKLVSYYTEWAIRRGDTVLYDVTNDVITIKGHQALAETKGLVRTCILGVNRVTHGSGSIPPGGFASF